MSLSVGYQAGQLLVTDTYRITKSNSEEVDYTSVKADSVGGDGGDIPAIYKLNELVDEN